MQHRAESVSIPAEKKWPVVETGSPQVSCGRKGSITSEKRRDHAMTAQAEATRPTPTSARGLPIWFWTVAALGVLWNAYGVLQFFESVTATEESLMSMGMDEVQAQTISTYPIWMTAAFAAGTFGGLIGSVLLLLRRRAAVPLFVVSLAGYVVLYIGDITEGVFVALGASQVAILSLVVIIASGLLWTSRIAVRKDILR